MYSGPMSMFPPPAATPRCCRCIPMRLGCSIICLIWAGFSMYMAVLSFQNTNLIYSYMPSATITVYGVVSLILSLVSVGGLIIFITNAARHVHTLSHAIFVCVFLVLADGFINLILFITYKNNYYNDCVGDSSTSIVNSVNSTLNSVPQFDFRQDYYNCNKLWQDELKFGIFFYILMFSFYAYWALCIYSYSLVIREFIAEAYIRSGGAGGNVPMMGGVALPPNAMMSAPGAGAGGPFPPPNDRQVIVLNSTKPSSKTKRRIDTFSYKHTSPEKLRVPFSDHKRDSQFTIGFRLSPDGSIIDIENAPSPTPTFIGTTPKPKDDINYY